MPNQTQQKQVPVQTASKALKNARLNVIKQASLAIFTIAVTVIMLFAMTTAWYTNVVQTSGLTFEADAWGFEGAVLVDNQVIKAAPGDSGVVEMSITNESDQISELTVNVSKEFMLVGENKQDRAMQQRLYFYIDEQSVINGETVSRKYLSNTSGHSYTLFGQNELILSEELHTDSLLKWEWVFDVVGYYVRASFDEETQTMKVEEYLRPVVYDPYEATYTTDKQDPDQDPTEVGKDPGFLETIDGEMTVNEFLVQLTETDGYPGAYEIWYDDVLADKDDIAITPKDGYYPIYEDDEQEIWLYLCTKSEIDANTRWDTAFGMLSEDEEADAQQFQARITVIGQQVVRDVVTVSDPEDLNQILRENEGSIVQLQSDMILDETSKITLENGTNAILDLNGHEITYTGANAAFDLDGANLTAMNGTIKCDPNQKSNAVYAVGSQITMSNMVISDAFRAFNVEDHKTEEETGSNSNIRLVNCDITTKEVSVKINGDGYLSGEKTHLVVQNCKIVSTGYAGILGNGNVKDPGQWGTDIQVINSEISGFYTAIYHPQHQSNLTISDSKLSGITGMVIKAGDVLVVDSEIRGTGTGAQIVTPGEDLLTGNGFLDTGDGIYVETDYKKPVNIEIRGSSTVVTAADDKADAIRVFPAASYVKIRISGGVYSDGVYDYVDSGYECVGTTGGYIVQKKS